MNPAVPVPVCDVQRFSDRFQNDMQGQLDQVDRYILCMLKEHILKI